MKVLLLILISTTARSALSEDVFNLTIFYNSNVLNHLFRKPVGTDVSPFLSAYFTLSTARTKYKKGDGCPFVYLNTGNTFDQELTKPWQWYMEFLNTLRPAAAGLSWFRNARTMEEVEPFFKLAHFPILACNIRPKNKVIRKIVESSTVINFNETKVGIIGYISKEKRALFPADEDLGFKEEISAIWDECSRLVNENVTRIIAMGYSDLITDLKVAEAVECVDLVIGSDFEIFSWNNTPIDVLKNERNPLLVENYKGKVIPVVQKHDKSMGEIKVSFNQAGNIISVHHHKEQINKNYEETRHYLRENKATQVDIFYCSHIIIFLNTLKSLLV